MYKLLILSSLIFVISIQNPIFSLFAGIGIGILLKNNLQEAIKSIGSLPLQIGIVLMGFSVSYELFSNLTINYFPIISIFVILTFLLGLLLGKIFKLDKKYVYLISAATSICGASAALAISPIIKAKPNQISLAIFIIFLMNAVALMLFPLLGSFFNFTDIQFGFFSALAIHDTGSVVGSGLIYSNEAGEIAATLKVGRTIWILPLIILISYISSKKSYDGIYNFPKFILFFLLAILLSNVFNIPSHIQEIFSITSIIFINIGIFFIGLQTNFEKIKDVSTIIFPLILWIIVVLISFIVVSSL